MNFIFFFNEILKKNYDNLKNLKKKKIIILENFKKIKFFLVFSKKII